MGEPHHGALTSGEGESCKIKKGGERKGGGI
jgi:hypothetical protein